jgi:hypothetical protein
MMTRQMRSLRCALVALCALGVAAAAGAQTAPRSFSFYGQLVSFDAASKMATISAQARDHIPKQVARFKPGDKVVVTWSMFKGEGDLVAYVPSADEMKTIDVGFIVPAELVSADANAKTITFKRQVPDNLVAAFQAIKPGTWIKMTMPMEQPNQTATLTAVVAAAQPAPRPKVVTVDPVVVMKEAAAAPLAQIAGVWTVTTSLGGMEISSDCTFTQNDKALTGSCQLGPMPVPLSGGEVAGRTVKFSQKADFGGTAIDLAYSGIVDAAGTGISGTVSFFGMDAGFTAKKK